jgi:hypothetical protein
MNMAKREACIKDVCDALSDTSDPEESVTTNENGA